MNAIALLQAALSLIIAINSATGPIPDELRVQALTVANNAIVVAQAEIARIEANDEDEDNDSNMNEDNGNGNAGAGANDEPADAPALGSIKIKNQDRDTGLGRDFKAITDDSIERWDQASDMANILVLDVEVYDANGSRLRGANVHVEATDDSQSKDLGGKTSYQYLFKTPGEHTLTFSVEGAEDEVITVNAD